MWHEVGEDEQGADPQAPPRRLQALRRLVGATCCPHVVHALSPPLAALAIAPLCTDVAPQGEAATGCGGWYQDAEGVWHEEGGDDSVEPGMYVRCMPGACLGNARSIKSEPSDAQSVATANQLRRRDCRLDWG